MLIMNQNRDALVDTTGARIKIDEFNGGSLNRYRVSWYGAGMRETISEHVDLEEAKKVVEIIHLATYIGMDACDFNGDMSNLDDVLKGLRNVTTRKAFNTLYGM